MTDPKRNPNKLRRPFIWRKRDRQSPESIKLAPDFETTQRPERPWYRTTILKTAAVALGILIIVPPHAHGQFGLDTAATGIDPLGKDHLNP